MLAVIQPSVDRVVIPKQDGFLFFAGVDDLEGEYICRISRHIIDSYDSGSRVRYRRLADAGT